jgi:hypothetical protein
MMEGIKTKISLSKSYIQTKIKTLTENKENLLKMSVAIGITGLIVIFNY